MQYLLGRSFVMPDAAQPASLLLIIDDNPGSLELLSNALAQPGLGDSYGFRS